MAVTTYHDLEAGRPFDTPALVVGEALADTLVEAGGYTHPLFTDREFAARSGFGRAPLPGQAVLLIMGGLVEQSGRFDETVVALTGFEDVHFLAPAFAGDALHVEVEVLGKEPSPSGRRGTLVMAWRCRNERGETLVDATARMMFRLD